MRHVLRILGLAAALLVPAASSQAGPTLSCPNGPDPLRFRPEFALADVANEPEPVALAAARDAVSGRELVAVAFLTPAHEVAVALSADGGCIFGPGGGGFAPQVVSAAGDVVTDRPAVALRSDDDGVLLAVAWRAGSRIVVRGTDVTNGNFSPEAQLDDAAAGPPRLACAAGPPRLFGVAWLRNGATGPVAAWSATVAPADAAAWAARLESVAPGAPDDVALACDASGGAGPACTMLVTLASGQALMSRSDDGAGPYTAWTRVDDGSPSRIPKAALAASPSPGASGSWVVPAWAARERTGGAVSIDADARAVLAGAETVSCDGTLGRANPAFGTAPEARPAPAVLEDPAGPLAFVLFEQAGEIVLARRAISPGTPRLQAGCGPVQLTGLSPLRTGGAARAPAAAAFGSEIALAFVDDRLGPQRLFVKRSDGAAPVVALAAANAAGCGNAPRVDLSWALPCDAALVTVEVGTSPGGTDFTRTAPASAAGMQVEGLEPGTTYYFRLRVLDAAGNEGIGPEASAATPGCSPADVDATLVSMTDTCVVGGAGGDGNADPGETLRVTVRLANSGTADATGARAALLSRTGALTVRTGTQTIGDIAVGGFADVVFDVDVSATISCGTPLELLARADAGGAAWSDMLVLPIAVPCTTCRVAGCSARADATRTLPLTICRGAQVTLDAGASSVASCAGVPVYEWWSGTTLLGTSAAMTQSPTGNTTYRLVVRCSTDFDCFDETTVDVVVNQRPTLSIDMSPPPPYCEGDTVTLTAVCGDPAARFAWSDGSTAATTTLSASGTASVTATDSNGCTRTRAVRADFGVIPTADAGPDVAGCGATRIGTTGFPLLDYSWDPPGGLSDARSAQPLASPPVPTTYTLTVTDPLTGCAAQDSVLVDVSPGPGPYRDFRVARNATGLALSWELLPGALAVRAYAERDVTRAAAANGASATARLLCEGGASCSAPMPPETLIFLQAVGVCADGINEGPN